MPDSKLPLLLSVTLALRAAATHSTCSWQIGPLQPTNYGFKHFCAASADVDGEDKAYFKCDHGSAGYLEGIKIADWGILHPNLLELATPCGGNGYGRGGRGVRRWCLGPHWGVCIGEIESGNCFYFDMMDDCVWPEFFYKDTLPKKLEVWVYSGPFRSD